MKQNLRRTLLCAALAGLPFIHMKAYDWFPVGTSVDADGFALNAGVYENGDYIADDAPNRTTRNSSFKATNFDDTLNIYGSLYDPSNINNQILSGGEAVTCPLKVNGNIILDATQQSMTVNVINDGVNVPSKVIIEPYLNPPPQANLEAPIPLAEAGCSQIYFNTALGNTITMNIATYLEFRSKTEFNVSETTPFICQDMILTFAGRGTVVFNVADGVEVRFNGQIDNAAARTYDPETGLVSGCPTPTPGCGTKVFVLMDQTEEDIANGLKKVVFQRYDASDIYDQAAISNSPDRVLVEVGPNSVITYLSTNLTGLPSDENSNGGYGSVAFDPSNLGTGRMVLFVRGAYLVDTAEFIGEEPNPTFGKIVEKYPLNDGAVLVNGHYVPDFSPETISGCDLTRFSEISEVGPLYDFTKPAGIRAILCNVDNKFYNYAEENPGVATGPNGGYAPSLSQRRGLLVVNDVQNHGKLFADPYWDLYTPESQGYIGVTLAQSNPVNGPVRPGGSLHTRRGFVVGINGMLDVYHNTFIDHASGAINEADPYAVCDYVDGSLLKSRNPSALIVDGFDTALFVNGNPFEEGTPSEFLAANQYTQNNPVRASIQLRGSGTLFVRESGSSAWGYFYNLAQSALGLAPVDDPTDIYRAALDNPGLNWTFALQVGVGSYDGYRLSPNEDTKQSGEGEHVFDVEGQLYTNSVPAYANDDLVRSVPRSYDASTSSDQGHFNAASVLIDYTGQEVSTNGDGFYISRPLLLPNDVAEYARYNSPTLFFNNFASFFNTVIVHSDATKCVDCVPNLSEPGITGGERLYFSRTFWDSITDATSNHVADPDRYRFPEIQLFNSNLELHESLNYSGVRFVVKDIPDYVLNPNAEVIPFTVDRSGDNTSYITFFDHGDSLDTGLTGHGRLFAIGSRYNQMSDGTNNCITDSAFVNVYKHDLPINYIEPDSNTLSESAQVKLSLQNGDEFEPATQAVINGLSGFAQTSFISKQRAHHIVCIAQPQHFGVTIPPCLISPECQATCNFNVGWSDTTKFSSATFPPNNGGVNAPAGDAGAFPGSFPYSPYYGLSEPLIPTNVTVPPNDNQVFTSEPFLLDALFVPPATVSVDGSVICFGSFDKDGHSLPVPVATDNDSGVVYVKHGGKITITRPAIIPIPGSGERFSIPQRSVFSTMLAQRIWNDYNFDGNQRVVQLTGIVDLPHDQVLFDANYGVQPYNFTDEMFAARRDDTQGFVRVSFENEDRDRTLALGNKSGGKEVTIGWRYRDIQPFLLNTETIPPTPDVAGTAGNVLPKAVPAAKKKAISEAFKWLLRATESSDTPQARPTDLLYIGAGDDIVQMKVAGATYSDPFALAISGDGVRPTAARVREFVSLKSTRNMVADRFISEGQHAVLFLDFNGRIGLGDRHWNELSTNAWNLLGKDYVSICPLGDGCVDLNSNLLVTDRLAIIPSDTFGSTKVDRLTFSSEAPLEIRVPANGELDLSGFGQAAHRQEIAFGENIKLVLEEGATIRFPDTAPVSEEGQGLVLYFNDQSQLVFEESCGSFLPFTDSCPANELNNAPIANSRIRLLGQGQIWLNKDASMNVNGTVYVGVETDALTPTTDITVSVQRQGAFYIGTDNLPGGVFQVGNQTELSNEEQTHSINFSLILNGPDSLFHIDREGFFGLGAGIINKYGAPNGAAGVTGNPVLNGDGTAATTNRLSDDAIVPVFNPDNNNVNGVWQVVSLYDVNNVLVQVQQGIFSHRNMFDGSSDQASLLAVGPANQYTLNINGNDDATVRGGGNVMYVPSSATYDPKAPIFVNIWDYSGPMYDGEEYGVLASGPLLTDRSIDLGSTPFLAGHSFVFAGASASASFANLLAFQPVTQQTYPKIDLSQTRFATVAGYTTDATARYSAVPNSAQIVRGPAPALINSSSVIADGVDTGALGADVIDGIPDSFSVIE